MNNHTQQVLDDPSVSYFTKQIIREGLEKDPVDAVAYVELALLILKEKMNNHTQSVLDDPSVSYFTKDIIREGLEKYPVDAVAYVELALEILKEELLSKLY
jgi:hypothetical protein